MGTEPLKNRIQRRTDEILARAGFTHTRRGIDAILQEMNQSDRRNYEMHLVVALKIESDDSILDLALRNIDAFESKVGTHPYYEEWRSVIRSGKERVIQTLLDTGERGQTLRSSSPFVGALTNDERMEVIDRERGNVR